MAGTPSRARSRREREHFDRLARDQGEVWWGHLASAGPRRSRRRAELVLRWADIGPGQRALEVGCGAGYFTRHYVDHLPAAAHVTAIDISGALVELSRARPELAGRANLAFEVRDVEHLPYAGGTFDAVIGSSVLHHLDLARVLPELWRVLTPGGRFAFAEPNALNPVLLAGRWLGIGHGCHQASPDERPFSRFRAVRELARHGFLVQRVQP
ncbi:MAG: class I SAM-dependent methyltransferase, partial [Planctomycetota bacterium]